VIKVVGCPCGLKYLVSSSERETFLGGLNNSTIINPSNDTKVCFPPSHGLRLEFVVVVVVLVVGDKVGDDG